ncbi:MAG: hypothetical protein MMC33_006074 [Icmadophila ericetorum]|nr:hypothetical protein [Icmadophila ericetorum]
MPGALTLLAAIGASFSLLRAVVADPKPNVVGFDFKKEKRQSSALEKLQRRQKVVSADITNGDILYVINVTIGTPGQPFTLQLDTGSSDIWIPYIDSNACQQEQQACQLYGGFDPDKSSTFIDIAQDAFSIQYVDGSSITGDYISDVYTIGSTKLTNMTMGLATQASRALGIMGIGFQSGESIASQDPEYVYPNVINVLQQEGYINTLAYSLWLNDLDSNTGSILFGGVDTAKYHGSLLSIPIQPDAQSGTISSFTVALDSVNLADGSGDSQFSQTNLGLPVILDSGTTNTYLPDDIADAILTGVGATNDPTYGTLVPCSLASSPATFTFGFGGSGGPSINVALSEFVTPLHTTNGASAPTYPDGTAACVFGLQGAGQNPNLFGDTFLRSAYVVYDLTNEQIGLAQTNFNTTDSKIVAFTGDTIPGASAAASGAQVTQTFSGLPLQTGDGDGGATTGAPALTGSVVPTFNLGSGTHPTATATAGGSPSTSSSSSGKGVEAAAGVLRAPALEISVLTTAVVGLLGAAMGGAWFLL